MNNPTFQGDTIGRNRVLRVLFVCLGNSVRSIMAEHLANRMEGFYAASAGINPSSSIHHMTVECLEEAGVNVDEKQRPVMFSDKLHEGWDIIVSLDPQATSVIDSSGPAGDCKLISWDIKDPTGRPPEEFRRVRDELREKLEGLN